MFYGGAYVIYNYNKEGVRALLVLDWITSRYSSCKNMYMYKYRKKKDFFTNFTYWKSCNYCIYYVYNT